MRLMMKIQKQPNKWSCLPTAFSMVSGVPLKKIILSIGHDGSEIISELKDEHCLVSSVMYSHRAFHLQELILAMWKFGFYVTPLETCATFLINDKIVKQDITPYLRRKGVFLGSVKGKRHAVAWNGRMIYDPNGTIYAKEKFDNIEIFCLIGRR
jgi:hypothetical protein